MGSIFPFIEARRSRDYDVWRSRVRLLRENRFANALDPSQEVEHDALRATLGRDYRNPTPNSSYRGAFGHRLRRGSRPLTTGMLLGWLCHLRAFAPAEPFLESASLPGIDGPVVVAAVGLSRSSPVALDPRDPAGSCEHGSTRVGRGPPVVAVGSEPVDRLERP